MDLMRMADLRRLVLKGLLLSLALAAVAGVVAVLVTNRVIFRVMGTGFLTAGAALLLLPCSVMVDRAKWRSAGLLGMAAVVVEFILVLLLIWEAHDLLRGGWSLQVSLWVTVGVVGGASVAAMIFLAAMQRKDTRVAGNVGLALSGLFFLISMIAAWQPTGLWEDEWWATAATVASLGPLVVVALVAFGRGDRHHWRWVGVGASAVAAVLLLVEFWGTSIWKNEEEIISIFVAVALYVAYANLVVRVPLTSGQRWLRIGSLITGAATAVTVEMVIFDLAGEFLTRLAAASAILTACGGMALAVLARLNRRVDFESPARDLAQITIFCPRCRKKQSIALGGAACKACGLRIDVQAEEPTCAKCGYLLYKLTTDVCPECGTPIRILGVRSRQN